MPTTAHPPFKGNAPLLSLIDSLRIEKLGYVCAYFLQNFCSFILHSVLWGFALLQLVYCGFFVGVCVAFCWIKNWGISSWTFIHCGSPLGQLREMHGCICEGSRKNTADWNLDGRAEAKPQYIPTWNPSRGGAVFFEVFKLSRYHPTATEK